MVALVEIPIGKADVRLVPHMLAREIGHDIIWRSGYIFFDRRL